MIDELKQIKSRVKVVARFTPFNEIETEMNEFKGSENFRDLVKFDELCHKTVTVKDMVVNFKDFHFKFDRVY